MKIIAVTNIKGGVGKTTTAVNLAYLAARAGARTLLWDLDAQGAATYTLQVEPGERVSAKQLVGGRRELDEAIVRRPTTACTCCPPTCRTGNSTCISRHASGPRNGC